MPDETFAVLATGPSMSAELAESIHGRCRAVAVCDAYRIAPWAEAIVCTDRGWWSHYPDALKFAGRKFCATQVHGTERLLPTQQFPAGTNSGLQGMRVAELLGATRILLLGFDMHGTHFFGKHPPQLANTTAERFRVHIAQFKRWKGAEVVNCTPDSTLKQFPFADLEKALAG